MKNLLAATFYVAFALVFALPVEAQYGQPAYQPGQPVYQGSMPYQAAPGYPMPVAQPVNYYPVPVQAMPAMQGLPVMQPVQSMQPVQPVIPMQPVQPFAQKPAPGPNVNANSGSYETNTLSPYEQQELALKEAKMIRELESMEKSREMSESFRQSDSPSLIERGYVQETASGKRGRFRKLVGGVGNAFKNGARVAAPAAASLGTSVGTFFIMRAALGPPTY